MLLPLQGVLQRFIIPRADALGYVLVAPSGRALNACANSLIQLTKLEFLYRMFPAPPLVDGAILMWSPPWLYYLALICRFSSFLRPFSAFVDALYPSIGWPCERP